MCESRLAEAEWASVWDHLRGGPYPREGLTRIWERVVFDQFHDILPGSAIHESNQDSAAGYRVALAGATGIRDRALRRLADRVRVDPDKGQPVIVFNPQPRQRTSLVEAEIFTYNLPETVRLSGWMNFYDSARVEPADAGQGTLPGLLLRDASGRTIPAQIVWGKQFPPGWRIRILFVAENLPAGGYRTFYVNPDEAGESGPVVRTDEQTFETQFFRIGFDLSNGEITRLYDRRRKIDYVRDGKSLNRLKIYLEDPQSTDAWRLGNVLDVQKVTGIQSVRITENGPVRACVEAVKTWGRSKFIQKTFIYKTYPRIVGETGGKDFIFVHASADVDVVATALIRGAFEYQGQKCSAASRAYIPDNLWPAIRERMVEELKTVKMGDVTDFSNFMTAVIDEPAFDSIVEYIEYAKKSGEAEFVTGGQYNKSRGYFIEPTIIRTTNPKFKLMEEEIFGPVLTVYVYPAAQFSETLELCDTTSAYALTGSIMANDRRAVVEAFKALRHAAGNFYINDKCTGAVVSQQPFGGGRASGTNDKGGSYLNLLRWTSVRSVKETLNPPKDYRYPFLAEK